MSSLSISFDPSLVSPPSGLEVLQDSFNVHPLFFIQGKGGTSALPLWVQKWLQRFVQDGNGANFFLQKA